MNEYKQESWAEVLVASAFALGVVYQLNYLPSKFLTNKESKLEQNVKQSPAPVKLKPVNKYYIKPVKDYIPIVKHYLHRPVRVL